MRKFVLVAALISAFAAILVPVALATPGHGGGPDTVLAHHFLGNGTCQQSQKLPSQVDNHEWILGPCPTGGGDDGDDDGNHNPPPPPPPVGTLTAAAAPNIGSSYLCYSKFEQDSGMVAVVPEPFSTLLKAGYWKPYAVLGIAPSKAFVQVGAYYLSCNPASTLKATSVGVDTNGFVGYSPSAITTAATVFAIVA